MSNNKTKVKTRNWCFIVYPESAAPDWRTTLKATGVPGFISPLHDKDVDADGKPKKKHYHGNLFFKGPTTFNAVRALTDQIKATIPQRIWDPAAAYEYATHKNAPDKYQYDPADIDAFNGFDIIKYQGDKTDGEKLQAKRKVNQLIKEQGIYEYSKLIDYLEARDENDLLEAVMSNSYHYCRLLDSFRYGLRESLEGYNQIVADIAKSKGEMKNLILEVLKEIKQDVR